MDNPIASTTSGFARCAKAQERISGAAPGGSRGVPRRDSDRQLRRRRLSVGTCVSQVRRGFLRVPHEARRHGKERDRAPGFLPSRHGSKTAHVTPLPLDWVRFPPRRGAAHGCLPLRFHGRRARRRWHLTPFGARRLDGRPRLLMQPRKSDYFSTACASSRPRHEKTRRRRPCRNWICVACHYPFSPAATIC